MPTKHEKRKSPIGPTGLLRKRPEAYASAIEPSRSGTWSPNRFSLFERLARSWFILFSLDAYEAWMFLSSNLVEHEQSLIRIRIRISHHTSLTVHLCESKYHFLYPSLSRSSLPLKSAWCLSLISWFNCEHVRSSSASCSLRLDKVFCCFAYSISPSLFSLKVEKKTSFQMKACICVKLKMSFRGFV